MSYMDRPLTGVRVKIREGTRSESGAPLCVTCRFSHVLKGAAESQEVYFCGVQDGAKVPFRVVECNRWEDKTTPTLYMLEDLAWVLRTDKLGRTIGFTRPGKDADSEIVSTHKKQAGFVTKED